MFVPLARQTKDAAYNGERLLNYIAHPSDTISQLVLLEREGLQQVDSLSAPVRAMLATEDFIAIAANGRFWIWDGTASDIGGSADGETYIAGTRHAVAVVAGGKYCVYDATDGSFTEYTTGSVENPRGVTYMDGYWVVWGDGQGRTDVFQGSALDDPTTFDPLDLRVAEASGDEIRAITPLNGQLWVFGSKTIESWFNAGASTGIFNRSGTGAIERGCIDGRTVAKDERGLFFVGSDYRVYRTFGAQPQVISTPEIEKLTGDVRGGFFYRDRGHRFYVLTRPGKTSLAYDTETGLWAERGTGNGEWVAQAACDFQGKQYTGTLTGLSQQSENYHDDNGTFFTCEAISPPMVRDARFTVSVLELDMDTGRTDIGREPQVMGQFSEDGETWTQEAWRGLGLLGNYKRQVEWRALGSFDKRMQARFRSTDPVKRDIYGARYG